VFFATRGELGSNCREDRELSMLEPAPASELHGLRQHSDAAARPTRHHEF
jgi:hypothetical protein